MNKAWTIIEKVIAVLLSIWGIIALYGVASAVSSMSHSSYAIVKHISYFQLLLNNHLYFLLALVTIFSGFLLLFNDKLGWVLSTSCVAVYMITFFRTSQASSTDSSQLYYVFSKSYSLMALLFLIMLALLIQKPFIKKYHVTFKNWILVAVIVTVLILDKLFLK
jgi:hypothetical protein